MKKPHFLCAFSVCISIVSYTVAHSIHLSVIRQFFLIESNSSNNIKGQKHQCIIISHWKEHIVKGRGSDSTRESIYHYSNEKMIVKKNRSVCSAWFYSYNNALKIGRFFADTAFHYSQCMCVFSVCCCCCCVIQCT